MHGWRGGRRPIVQRSFTPTKAEIETITVMVLQSGKLFEN